MDSSNSSDDSLRWSGSANVNEAEAYFEGSSGSTAGKLAAFPRFVDRTSLARFLVKYDVFRSILDVHGVVVECGVLDGGGLFSFAQFSALLEPLNHRRRVVGFDTFEGFPSVSSEDTATGSAHAHVGNYAGSSSSELERGIALFDAARALNQIPKIELVAGDFRETGPRYLEDHPELLVSLLYLDFDLYDPTKLALELFLPRMPRGAVVMFDQLGSADFPGETTALLETLDLAHCALARSGTTSLSWITLSGQELRKN